MRIRRLGTTCAFLSLAFPLAAAAGEGDFFAAVRAALDEGRVGREEALADLFRYAFEPGALPAGLAEGETLPLKCLTPSIAAFEEARRSLDPALVAEIETYLGAARAPGKRTTLTYDSPGGNFTLNYETSGSNAPPQEDVDPANGVPDYVEWVAGYCDSSWNREIDGLGFNPPALNVGERYQIYFQNMGAYGYTMSTGGGRSYIVIENDFVGFPANQDPDGNQKGAAKATVAHEFKHASQMNTTGAMAMGGWVELDATWMEDVVYDSTNDYYNYLGSGSGISDPDQSLDYGGSGSYEDCIWQHHLSEVWGVGMGLAFMQRREAYPTETAVASYAGIIADQGSDFMSAFTEYATWNYLSGFYATDSLPGYEEATGYPTPNVWDAHTAYPDTAAGSVDKMAAHFHLCRGMASISQNLRIRFTGQAGKEQRVVLLLRRKGTLGGGWFREDIDLDSTNSGDHTVGMPPSDLKQIAVLVINPKKRGSSASYTLILEESDAATGIAAAPPVPRAFGLEQNRPNPFNPSTSIAFTLPRPAIVSLVVYSPAGRAVRTLLADGRLGAGRHETVWDGRDDSGRSVSSGVYHYRLKAQNLTDTKRMILIR